MKLRAHLQQTAVLALFLATSQGWSKPNPDRHPACRNLADVELAGLIRISTDALSLPALIEEIQPKPDPRLKHILEKTGSQYYELKDTIRKRIQGTRYATAGLTDDEIVALVAYTGSFFKSLNRALRTEEDVDDYYSVSYMDALYMAEMIHKALGKLPDYRGKVVRWSDMPYDVAAAHQPGKIVEYKGFTSASLDHSLIWPGKYRFVIQSKTGKVISPLSYTPEEEEVLFRAGTRFKILERKENGYRVDIVMEEVTGDSG